jgi:hypothetical protein
MIWSSNCCRCWHVVANGHSIVGLGETITGNSTTKTRYSCMPVRVHACWNHH